MTNYIHDKEKRELSEKDICSLREKIKPYLTDKRYSHTLYVEREAEKIGELLMPHEINRLRAAALLHDITKKDDLKKQLQYCEEFGIIICNLDILSPSVFHAMTAAKTAERDFADFTDPEILGGVRWHTTGHDQMTDFEAIVYLADYIEETRKFDDCVKLRNYFWNRINCGEDKDTVLCDTMIYSFDLTIQNLIKDVTVINSDTIGARNYYIAKRKAKKADEISERNTI